MQDSEGYVEIEDNLRLFYRQVGHGSNAVVIPGASLLSKDFLPLAKTHQLIFYDSRGRGRSDRDPNPDHIWTDYEVRDLETVRNHFGLDKLTLCGWSYWGGISALYASHHPAIVSRLVLICPISPRSPAPYDDKEGAAQKEQARIDPAAGKALREWMKSGRHITEPEKFCREFQRVITPRQMGIANAINRMKSDPCSCLNEWWHHLREHHALHFPTESRYQYDWREKIQAIEAPSLIIHGKEDLIPEKSSQEWADHLQNGRLFTLEEVGHYPHLEAPEQFFPVVKNFLAAP
ncbi:MAG: alpha/beta hydrolase [Chloroflexota bacterium]